MIRNASKLIEMDQKPGERRIHRKSKVSRKKSNITNVNYPYISAVHTHTENEILRLEKEGNNYTH